MDIAQLILTLIVLIWNGSYFGVFVPPISVQTVPTSIYIQKITDHVLVGGNINLLNLLSVIMIILLALQVLISVFKDIFLIKTGQQIDVRLILGYYKHLLRLPQQFFDNMRVGEIISRITDAVKIRNFINGVALNLMVNILILIFLLH